MATTTLIRASPGNFSLAQKLITALSEKYNFQFDEAWDHVSKNSVQQLHKRFRRLKREQNPYSKIKKQRTAFTFFTKAQRSKIAAKHPEADFGTVSKHTSKAWNSLNDKQRDVFKKLEAEDKARYIKEKAELATKLESESSSTESASTTESPSTLPTPQKGKSTKGKGAKGKKSDKGSKKTTPVVIPPDGYKNFQKKQREMLKSSGSKLGLKAMNTKIGEMWRDLADTEKATYV